MKPSLRVENPLAFQLRAMDGLTPFAKELVTSAADTIDKLTDEMMMVRSMIGPRPMPGIDYTEKFKAQLYDELCAAIHTQR